MERQNCASLAAGGLGPAVELRVHPRAAELDRDRDGPLPVAHRGPALGLVRPGPAEERQDGHDLHAGRGERRAEGADARRSRCAGARKKGMKSSRGDSSMAS